MYTLKPCSEFTFRFLLVIAPSCIYLYMDCTFSQNNPVYYFKRSLLFVHGFIGILVDLLSERVYSLTTEIIIDMHLEKLFKQICSIFS